MPILYGNMQSPIRVTLADSSRLPKNKIADARSPRASHSPSLMPDLQRWLVSNAIRDCVVPDNGLEVSPISTVQQGKHIQMERYIFTGPQSDEHPLRLAFFGMLREEDPFSPYAMTGFIQDLVKQPQLAAGLQLYFYPFSCLTRHADRRGGYNKRDIFVDLWKDAPRPEVYLIERELSVVQFHGAVTLLTLQGLGGLSIQSHGLQNDLALQELLVQSALADGGCFCPLASAKDWLASWRMSLTAGGDFQPKPFELSVKIPLNRPAHEQIWAQRMILHSILKNSRAMAK
jgi:hypothetical protein